MFDFKNGEIFIAKFDPSVGHEFQKDRPAIVVQSDKKLLGSSLITIVGMTSSAKNMRRDDILVKKDSFNRLYLDSVIKVGAIYSFDRSRFIKKIGRIDPAIMNQIKSYLKTHFDL